MAILLEVVEIYDSAIVLMNNYNLQIMGAVHVFYYFLKSRKY